MNIRRVLVAAFFLTVLAAGTAFAGGTTEDPETIIGDVVYTDTELADTLIDFDTITGDASSSEAATDVTDESLYVPFDSLTDSQDTDTDDDDDEDDWSEPSHSYSHQDSHQEPARETVRNQEKHESEGDHHQESNHSGHGGGH